MPAVLTFFLLILIRLHWLPFTARPYLQWMVLTFPVLYSLYILTSEVLTELPQVWRRGGVANTLVQPRKDSQWRERVTEALGRALPSVTPLEWAWIVASFRIDLDTMKSRTRYLTGLAAAVFYLILQGIDSLADTEATAKTTWTRSPIFGWIENSTNLDIGPWLAFGVVLVLLYLSGSQTHQTLMRYQTCAELIQLQAEAAELQSGRRA